MKFLHKSRFHVSRETKIDTPQPLQTKIFDATANVSRETNMPHQTVFRVKQTCRTKPCFTRNKHAAPNRVSRETNTPHQTVFHVKQKSRSKRLFCYLRVISRILSWCMRDLFKTVDLSCNCGVFICESQRPLIVKLTSKR